MFTEYNSKIPEKGTVLLFFAADWCGYCKMMSIELNELIKKNKDITIINVDIDKHPIVAKNYGVMGIPVLVLFKDGKKIKSTSGYKPLEMIEKFIK